MNIDKSLDEIVTAAKKSRGPRVPRGGASGGVGPRRGGGQQPQANRRVANVQSGKVPTGPKQFSIPGLEGVVGDKIVISNLPDDVTEVQIKVSLDFILIQKEI